MAVVGFSASGLGLNALPGRVDLENDVLLLRFHMQASGETALSAGSFSGRARLSLEQAA